MNENTNNSDNNRGGGMGAGSGVVIGAVIVIIILVVTIVLSLPYIRQQIDSMTNPGNPTINVTLPLPAAPSGTTTPGN